MKNLFLIVTFTFSFATFAQSESFVGNYTRIPNLADGTKMKWTLSLNADGTFLYNFYRDIAGKMNPAENFMAKVLGKQKSMLFTFLPTKKQIWMTYTQRISLTKKQGLIVNRPEINQLNHYGLKCHRF
ncbi:hypothetical protein [Mariniflexile sp.]|uniref:hypothetical protein n=1 Tax=Mariniflexile sp. TaxID=1979402 RepID=UPI00404895D0